MNIKELRAKITRSFRDQGYYIRERTDDSGRNPIDDYLIRSAIGFGRTAFFHGGNATDLETINASLSRGAGICDSIAFKVLFRIVQVRAIIVCDTRNVNELADMCYELHKYVLVFRQEVGRIVNGPHVTSPPSELHNILLFSDKQVADTFWNQFGKRCTYRSYWRSAHTFPWVICAGAHSIKRSKRAFEYLSDPAEDQMRLLLFGSIRQDKE